MQARDMVLAPGHRLGVAIGSQVGRNPMGVGGNGYFAPPSGGITDVLLGASTEIVLPKLPGPTPVFPVP